MILYKPYTKQQYIDFISWCNQNDCIIEDTGDCIKAVKVPPQVYSIEDIKQQLVAAVQKHMDEAVKVRGYDNIASACSYGLSTVEKFRNEATACIAWRDAVWSYCYAQLELFENGERTVPSIEELIDELPALDW